MSHRRNRQGQPIFWENRPARRGEELAIGSPPIFRAGDHRRRKVLKVSPHRVDLVLTRSRVDSIGGDVRLVQTDTAGRHRAGKGIAGEGEILSVTRRRRLAYPNSVEVTGRSADKAKVKRTAYA